MSVTFDGTTLTIKELQITFQSHRNSDKDVCRVLRYFCPEYNRHVGDSDYESFLSPSEELLPEELWYKLAAQHFQHLRDVRFPVLSKRIAREVILQNPQNIHYVPGRFVDKELALLFVTSSGQDKYPNGWLIELLGPFASDYDVVHAAIKYERDSLFNGDISLLPTEIYMYTYTQMPRKFRSDPELTLMGIEFHPNVVTLCAPSLFCDGRFLHRLLHARINIEYAPQPAKQIILLGRALLNISLPAQICELIILILFGEI